MNDKINDICERLVVILIDIKDMRTVGDFELDCIRCELEDTDDEEHALLSRCYDGEFDLAFAEKRIQHLIDTLGFARRDFDRASKNLY